MKQKLWIILFMKTRMVFGIIGDGGAGMAQLPYLVKILNENIKRHQQLQAVIRNSKEHGDYLKLIHSGIENSVGILNSLPIGKGEVLSDLRDFQSAVKSVEKLYGRIPKSKESALQKIHDRTVAESFKMAASINRYAKRQEANTETISSQARKSSLKGAMRINAETNAQILHALNQILRVNGQILKLQGETLAMFNKKSKDGVGHFNKVGRDIKTSFAFKNDFAFPEF